MRCLSLSAWYTLNSIWWGLQRMKRLTKQFSLGVSYCCILYPDIFLSALFWNTLSLPLMWKTKYHTCKKVKQSHYRPGQALGVAGGWGYQIPRYSAHEGGSGCQPYAPATFTPHKVFLVLISVRGWVEPRVIVPPEGLCQWKNSSDTIGNRSRDLPACSAGSQVGKWLKFMLFAKGICL